MIGLSENFGGGQPEPQPGTTAEQIKELNATVLKVYEKFLDHLHAGIGSFVVGETKNNIHDVIEILKRRTILIRQYGVKALFHVADRDEDRILALEEVHENLDEANPLDSTMIEKVKEALFL